MRNTTLVTLILVLATYSYPATASRWQYEKVDRTGQVGRYTSLALDQVDLPHISYFDETNGDLKYARYSDSFWEIEVVDSAGNTGLDTSIALDSADRPHISYYDADNQSLRYAYHDGTGWQTDTVDSDGDVGWETSIALDSMDRPHISYFDVGGQSLKYAHHDGSEWQVEFVDVSGNVGRFTSLVLDSDDHPHISYYDIGNTELEYAVYDGDSWQLENVDTAGDVGKFSVLVLDSSDQPHIAYYDVDGTDLKYAYYEGGGWMVETLGAADSGKFASLDLDSDDKPHVSYFDETNQDLGYAVRSEGSWQIQAVDSEGAVGRYTTIAIDSLSQPNISYFDIDGQSLKYAHYNIHEVGLLVGLGPGYENPPLVRVFDRQSPQRHVYEFQAYGAMHYGANVGAGDFNGDISLEILTGAGPGDIFGPHVRGFWQDGTPMPGLNFLAYGTNKFGVNVAAGDLDGDGRDEIITGAGPGAVFGPHVRAFDFNDNLTVTPQPGVSYFAYGTLKYGVNVAAGDVDGDGFDEIITGAGPGAVFGPHVRGWNVDGGSAQAMAGISFQAYGTFKYGVNVAVGDIDGDGFDEIITGPGPSSLFGAHVRGWNYDGSSITPLPGVSFFAWPTSQGMYGARVFAGADLTHSGRNEIVVGAGPDPEIAPIVKMFLYDGAGVTQLSSVEAFPTEYTHGVSVAAGSVYSLP